ncbi:N-acetylmuramoyl-L-alanine amidase family protein [Clostridium beijerinckii]|uniref:N-acetylmuramoyl-L-alanine amidase family protein n=1 Tax=Clostridium beijerinckii TaxID=1520 RepID=UPI00047A3D73|nr:N-acetylmuramoyl-L-alanine amidase family protein [Clostridium beijerinckii]
MFKRANKITALLVAATSVMAIVPAMAATKLGTKDGTIEKAVAFSDGKYLYQGYRTDDDDSGLYYNAGDKDKKLDDASEIDTEYGKYDDKYVAAQDGNNKYVVDLSTGKISDDDTPSDLKETAQTKLENKLKKTDRYNNDNVKVGTLQPISSSTGVDEFEDVWYAYSASTGGAISTTTTDGAANISYSGYTNNSGTYIDCSKDLNIYVYNGYKMIKLEELGDQDVASSEDKAKGAHDVKVTSITYLKTLAQDSKYIYRLVKVHVDGAQLVDSVSGGTETNPQELYYVQKISKEQSGSKEKDAYLPKTTESYQIADTLGDGDVKDAYNAIMDSYNYNGTAKDYYTYVVEGCLYSTFRDSDKVKTIKMSLKTSEKLKKNNVSNGDKVDGHVVKKDGDKDQKIEETNSNSAWTVDTKGNVWALKDGEILESTKIGDFKTVYTVDRSFDSLDVYDEKNLIAWEDGGDAYTTVGEGTKQAADDAAAVTPVTPAKVGWDKLADGTWNFYDATGAKVANNWVNVGGAWYFLKADGVMATGWQQVGGTWYYLAGSGAMATGWINDGGNWYYLNASGAMLANTTTPDGYYVGASGAWVR